MSEQQFPTIEIGEQKYEFRELTFKQIKKIWPIVKSKMEPSLNKAGDASDAANVEDAFSAADAAVEIVSIALLKRHAELTPDYIEDNLTTEQLKVLPTKVVELLRMSGMSPGEALPSNAAAAAGSTATGTP